MNKRNQMLQLTNEVEKALERALKLHGIEVAYDDLSEEQDEAWQLVQSKLNRMRGMTMAHVKE